MKGLLLAAALLIVTTAGAQNDGNTPWKIEKETFVYAVKGTDTLRLDRYVALTPDSRTKPCLLFLFGGGFMAGKRDDESFRSFFDHYAQKGFVVVAIDYRLGMKRAKEAGLLNENKFVQALETTLAMAVEDLYDATACICEHAPHWGVDTTRIVTCGSSAGAITALMGEYGICNEHPRTKHLPHSFRYAGVIAFAGAICDTGELRWLHAPAPMLLFHGDADRNVPYDSVSHEGITLWGSKRIAQELTRRRVPHWFHSVADTNHSMAWRPMRENRSEIDTFLEKLVFRRQPLVIDTHIVSLDAPQVRKDFTVSDYLEANYGH